MPPKKVLPRRFWWAGGHGRLEEFAKGAVWALSEVGYGPRELAAMMGMSRKTVMRVIRVTGEQLRSPVTSKKRKREYEQPAKCAKRQKIVRLLMAERDADDYPVYVSANDVRRRLLCMKKPVKVVTRTVQRDIGWPQGEDRFGRRRLAGEARDGDGEKRAPLIDGSPERRGHLSAHRAVAHKLRDCDLH